MSIVSPLSDLSQVADELGAARANLDAAKKRVEFLEGILKGSDVNVVEGDLFRVKISRDIEKVTIDWKAISAKLNPSRQLVKAYEKKSYYSRLYISALPKSAKEAA